ncbi:hypothetical protein M011DRAFT_481085 [Sporormia fimetaria CBS 119925]|uniref:Uncharacterized protein n=1 Tax=Sporormia fimetaria CBS 119925 TaxID=1340428 RepID=A0A6A6V0F6_9PLEO|nr:hypothetical protein M011DRAFT_481085 [Sporormia fimetaria CBS 119925]
MHSADRRGAKAAGFDPTSGAEGKDGRVLPFSPPPPPPPPPGDPPLKNLHQKGRFNHYQGRHGPRNNDFTPSPSHHMAWPMQDLSSANRVPLGWSSANRVPLGRRRPSADVYMRGEQRPESWSDELTPDDSASNIGRRSPRAVDERALSSDARQTQHDDRGDYHSPPAQDEFQQPVHVRGKGKHRYRETWDDGYTSAGYRDPSPSRSRTRSLSCGEGAAGYDTGYDTGYAAGYEAGYAVGHAAGYAAGYATGFDVGYHAGFNAPNRADDDDFKIRGAAKRLRHC